MPLDKQIVELAFAGGVDTKISDAHRPSTKLSILENGQFSKLGEIDKRNGFVSEAPTVSTMGDGANNDAMEKGLNNMWLGKTEGDLIIGGLVAQTDQDGDATDTEGHKALDYCHDADKYQPAGEILPLEWSLDDVSKGYNLHCQDMAVIGNYEVLAAVDWTETSYSNNRLLIVIRDRATRAIIREQLYSPPITETAADYYAVKVVVLDTIIYILHTDSDGYLGYHLFDSENPFNDLVYDDTSIGTIDYTKQLDAWSDETDYIWVAYKTTTDNGYFTVKCLDKTFTSLATEEMDIVPRLAIHIGPTATDGHIVIACQDNSDGYMKYCVIKLNDTLDAIVVVDAVYDFATPPRMCSSDLPVADTIYAIAVAEDLQYRLDIGVEGSVFIVWVNINHNDTLNYKSFAFFRSYTEYVVSGSGSSTGYVTNSLKIFSQNATDDISLYGQAIVSKMVAITDSQYNRWAVLVHSVTDTQQPGYFLVSVRTRQGVDTFDIDAKILHLNSASYGYPAGSSSVDFMSLPSFTGTVDNVYRKICLLKEDSGVNLVSCALKCYSYGLDASIQPPFVNGIRDEKNLIIGSGQIYHFDGRLQEMGFQYWPMVIYSAVVGTGSGLAVGTYSYKCYYRYIDRYGQVWRSTPSPAKTATVSDVASGIVALQLANLNFADYEKHLTVDIVICRTEATGTIYYEVGAVRLIKGNIAVAYDDSSTDVTISANAMLYTTGGVLENIAPPAGNILTISNKRLWIVGFDDRSQIWFSKVKTKNIGYEFNDALIIDMEDGGKITALADLDGKLIIFKESTIYYVYGDGPNDLGQGDFPRPIQITSEIGAESQRAVVATTDGIYFKSANGYYLLDKSLAVSYVGLDVAAYNSYLVSSAVVEHAKNQIRFTLTEVLSANPTHIMLVYDYLLKQWSTFKNLPFIYQSAMLGNQHCFVANYNKGDDTQDTWNLVYRESTAYVDGDASTPDEYPVVVQTAWIKLDQLLQGFQRLYWVNLLVHLYSECTITILMYCDYKETVVETLAFTYDSTAIAANPDLAVRFKPKYQKCEVVRLKITVTAAGQGASLRGLSLDLGKKRDSFKRAPTVRNT